MHKEVKEILDEAERIRLSRNKVKGRGKVMISLFRNAVSSGHSVDGQ